jgi:hypothetical protein
VRRPAAAKKRPARFGPPPVPDSFPPTEWEPEDRSARNSSQAERRLLIPEFVANHGSPVVQALVLWAHDLYNRRHNLRAAGVNGRGEIVFNAWPELLARPQAPAAKGRPPRPPKPDCQWRRADGMQTYLRVLLVVAACTDFRTMEVWDPKGGRLSVWRLAELANMSPRFVPVGTPTRRWRRGQGWSDPEPSSRNRWRFDRAERGLAVIRTARILGFTQQRREKLPDGRYVSTGAALRKLAVGFFNKVGGFVLKVFEQRHNPEDFGLKLKPKGLAANAGDLRMKALNRELVRNQSQLAIPTDDVAAAPPPTSLPPGGSLRDRLRARHATWTVDQINKEVERCLDAVAADLPDCWDYPTLDAEACRRLERGPPSLPLLHVVRAGPGPEE